jgi:hypothetical protein
VAACDKYATSGRAQRRIGLALGHPDRFDLVGRRLQPEAGTGAADVGQNARAVREVRKSVAFHVCSDLSLVVLCWRLNYMTYNVMKTFSSTCLLNTGGSRKSMHHKFYGNLRRKGFHNYTDKGKTLADSSRSSGPSTLMDVARQAGVSPVRFRAS